MKSLQPAERETIAVLFRKETDGLPMNFSERNILKIYKRRKEQAKKRKSK